MKSLFFLLFSFLFAKLNTVKVKPDDMMSTKKKHLIWCTVWKFWFFKQWNLRISPVDIILEQCDAHAICNVSSYDIFCILEGWVITVKVNLLNVVISLVTPEWKKFKIFKECGLKKWRLTLNLWQTVPLVFTCMNNCHLLHREGVSFFPSAPYMFNFNCLCLSKPRCML